MYRDIHENKISHESVTAEAEKLSEEYMGAHYTIQSTFVQI